MAATRTPHGEMDVRCQGGGIIVRHHQDQHIVPALSSCNNHHSFPAKLCPVCYTQEQVQLQDITYRAHSLKPRTSIFDQQSLVMLLFIPFSRSHGVRVMTAAWTTTTATPPRTSPSVMLQPQKVPTLPCTIKPRQKRRKERAAGRYCKPIPQAVAHR